MKRICVFCGSSLGRDPVFAAAAEQLGTAIARRGLELVYGGAHVGLMGVVANAVLRGGGRVVGVIPQSLVDVEVAHTELPDLRIVATMHERKALMEQLADGFIALPGGMGTLEELCEIFTWGQLGLHIKPCGVLDVAGYYAPFLQLLDGAVEAGFLRPEHRAMVLVGREPDELLARFDAYEAPLVQKWNRPWPTSS